MESGETVTADLLEREFAAVLAGLQADFGDNWDKSRIVDAAAIMKALVMNDDFVEFLTSPAYELIK